MTEVRSGAVRNRHFSVGPFAGFKPEEARNTSLSRGDICSAGKSGSSSACHALGSVSQVTRA